MHNTKTIYLRDLLTDLYKKRIFVLLFIIFSVLLFGFLGYRKAHPSLSLTVEQQKEVDEYNKRLDEYESFISDTTENLAHVERRITELQEYVDNSIYMKIDPQNIQTVSVQYAIISEASIDNIYNSFAYYINEGGLKDSAGKENENLQPEYWREIIACSLGGNVINITISHYDMEQARQIMNFIKKQLFEQVSVISEVQGVFSLEKIGEAAYVKSDVAFVNTQNGNLNNLKGFIANRTDLNNRLVSQENTKNSYIENDTPDVLNTNPSNSHIVLLKYMIVGFLFGIILPCAWFLLGYLLGNRIHSKDDLFDSPFAVIDYCKAKGPHHPSLERCVMDLNLMAQQNDWNTIFLAALSDHDSVKKVISDYKEALKQINLSSADGYHLEENADELHQLVQAKNCILFIQIGRTTYPQLEAHINLCKKFGITIQGYVVIE